MENQNKKVNKTEKVNTEGEGEDVEMGTKRVKLEEGHHRKNVLIFCNPLYQASNDLDLDKDLEHLKFEAYDRVLVIKETFPGFLQCEYTCFWIEEKTKEMPVPGTVITLEDFTSGKFKMERDEFDKELTLFERPRGWTSDENREKMAEWWATWEKKSGKKVSYFFKHHGVFRPVSTSTLDFVYDVARKITNEWEGKKENVKTEEDLIQSPAEDFFVYGCKSSHFLKKFYGELFSQPTDASLSIIVGTDQVVDVEEEKKAIGEKLNIFQIKDF